MSYKITCYCNDSTIKTTSFYIPSLGNTYSGTYGSSSLGDYEEFYVSGFTDSWSAKFTATPASNCNFSYWIYRLGSTSATERYSYDNPFTYSGGQDIYIRAVGERDVSWTRYTSSLGTITDLYEEEIYIDEYELYRFSVKFSTSGKAYFYTEGTSIDTWGFFGTSSGWNSSTGEPSSYIKDDDDGNGMPNFLISYDVTAGTTYYIWVRGLSGTSTGYTTLYIEPPESEPTWTLSSSNYGTLSADKTQSISMSSYYLYRRSVVFSTSGTATFYTTGSVDTKGYLTTTTTWDDSSGVPSPYVAYNDDGSDTNFSFTYDVTAGTQYYLWVRGYSATPSGTITIHIDVPEAVTVSKWSWSASNGNASASATSKAYTAVCNQGVVTNFSYLVWNDMVNKVVDILTALGDSWDSSYMSLANTKMASSDKVLTADRFNSLKYNIGSHYSTGLLDRVTGEIVYGGYITLLTDKMNEWIDSDL